MGRSLISKLARAAGARKGALHRRAGAFARWPAARQKVEAGGELIGPNHPTWLAYAKQFGLSLSELPESDEADSPILLNGRRLISKEVVQLWSALEQVLQSMSGDDRTINRQQPRLSAKLTLQSGAVLEADAVVLTAPPTTGWPAAAASKC